MSDTMPIAHPGFEGRGLALRPAGMWKGAGLVLDGQPVPMQGGVFLVKDNAGAQVLIKFVRSFIDPIPKLSIGGQVVTLAPPFTWYQYVFIALPLVLIPIGGLLGGLCGGVAAFVNAQLLRTHQPALVRYGLAVLMVLAALVVYLVIGVTLSLIFGLGR
jgi:hypothetical protein